MNDNEETTQRLMLWIDSLRPDTWAKVPWGADQQRILFDQLPYWISLRDRGMCPVIERWFKAKHKKGAKDAPMLNRYHYISFIEGQCEQALRWDQARQARAQQAREHPSPHREGKTEGMLPSGMKSISEQIDEFARENGIAHKRNKEREYE